MSPPNFSSIVSVSNQRVKDLVRLKDRRGDLAGELFVVEGTREIGRAIISAFELVEIFVCRDLLTSESLGILELHKNINVTEVSPAVYAKIATRDESNGIVAVFKVKNWRMADLENVSTPLFVVALENLEKPGNLGAILRTADGAGVNAVVTLGQKVDPWNQNVIRSSLGAVFSIPTIALPTNEFFEWVHFRKMTTVGAILSEKSTSIYDTKLSEPLVLLFGSEAHGLSRNVQQLVDVAAALPMRGVCDSLNVSVAAGIFIYEAVRQRCLASV